MNGYPLKTDITGIDKDKENLITYTNGELNWNANFRTIQNLNILIDFFEFKFN